jgi:hypothetical protein
VFHYRKKLSPQLFLVAEKLALAHCTASYSREEDESEFAFTCHSSGLKVLSGIDVVGVE